MGRGDGFLLKIILQVVFAFVCVPYGQVLFFQGESTTIKFVDMEFKNRTF